MAEVYGRAFGFKERETGQRTVRVYNATARKWDELELVYANGYFGEVRNTSHNNEGGIEAGSWGYICIDTDRVLETVQYKADEVFARADSAAEVPVYFTPQGADAGFLIDGVTTAPATGDVKVGILQEAKASGNDAPVVFKPLEPQGNLEVTA